MDKMREEFEDWWIRETGFKPERSCEFEGYRYDSANDMWVAWKASRAALCVEFPKQPKKIFAFDDGAFQVVKQLESCGIDVKNKPCWAIKLLESCKNKPLA